MLKSHIHKPRSGNKPASLIILLHGYGANGADLLDLAQYWESALPDAMFISPDAPEPCEAGPFGFQWFSLQNWSPASLLAGARQAEPTLRSFIDDQIEQYDVKPDRVALVGFSQGTMMSLYAAPRLPYQIAGVLGYSGALLGHETLTDASINKVPVHLVHGDMDMVVPVDAYHMSRAGLESAGFTVTGGVTRGLQHSIDAAGIQDGEAFLKSILP